MKHNYCILFIFFLFGKNCFSQPQDSIISPNIKNGISKSSSLSIHPLGILFTRAQGNFKFRPVEKRQLDVSIGSGNVWAAPVTAYIPNDQAVRDLVKNVVWHRTEFLFDVDTMDVKSIELQFDGVIKSLRVNTRFKLANEHELNVGIRMFLLTKGKFPFTSFTGDDFIESFHKNITGGDDPFGRKLFGLNKANLAYKDRNDNTINLTNGDLFLGGVETSYYYYPEDIVNNSKTFFMNFGAHLGTNLSSFNTSLDFGLSANAIKAYYLNDRNYFHLGLSLGSIRKNIIEFKNDNVDLGNNPFIGYLESALEYNYISKNGTTHSFSLDFYLQTSINKKNEFDYLIPIRNGVTEKSWNVGISHLYKNNNYWTMFYTFTRVVATTFFVQQDLTLNNNPDIQAGVNIAINL